jgi:hypothetical protein
MMMMMMMKNEDIKETVPDWLNRLAANFHDEGIIQLVHHMNKCLNHNGDYKEK